MIFLQKMKVYRYRKGTETTSMEEWVSREFTLICSICHLLWAPGINFLLHSCWPKFRKLSVVGLSEWYYCCCLESSWWIYYKGFYVFFCSFSAFLLVVFSNNNFVYWAIYFGPTSCCFLWKFDRHKLVVLNQIFC